MIGLPVKHNSELCLQILTLTCVVPRLETRYWKHQDQQLTGLPKVMMLRLLCELASEPFQICTSRVCTMMT